MRREIYKRFVIPITAGQASYNKKFDLDKTISSIKGLQVTSNKPNQVYYRGSMRLEVTGEELFPEDYDARLLMSGLSVSPDERFTSFGNSVLSGNGEIKILYKDTENTSASFEPYQVIFIFHCELA